MHSERVIDQNFLSKKILKLVVVLFNLKNGMQPSEVRENMSLERFSNKTDDLCNESDKNHIISLDESIGNGGQTIYNL